MNSRILILIFLLATVDGVQAQTDCGRSGSQFAHEISFQKADDETLKGLTVSFFLGLDPPTYPVNDIGAAKTPCKRGQFLVGARTYSLYGKGELPPRWASGPEAGDLVYLALLPRPLPALASYRADPKAGSYRFKADEWMYALATVVGDKRNIYRFYDALPDDTTLKRDMCSVLSGELPVLAVFDTTAGRPDFSGLNAPSPSPHNDCNPAA